MSIVEISTRNCCAADQDFSNAARGSVPSVVRDNSDLNSRGQSHRRRLVGSMDGQRVRRHLMRGFGHPIGGDKRSSECSRDGSGEFIVKRCAAAADETKLGRSGARVVFGGTVDENAVNRGYGGVPCHSEPDNVTPKQVSREPARARKVSAAAACQGSQ